MQPKDPKCLKEMTEFFLLLTGAWVDLTDIAAKQSQASGGYVHESLQVQGKVQQPAAPLLQGHQDALGQLVPAPVQQVQQRLENLLR